MRQKLLLIQVGYSVEVSGYDGNKIVWELKEDHVVNDTNENTDIGIKGFALNFL